MRKRTPVKLGGNIFKKIRLKIRSLRKIVPVDKPAGRKCHFVEDPAWGSGEDD